MWEEATWVGKIYRRYIRNRGEIAKSEPQVLTGIVPGLSSEARFKVVVENGVGV